MKVKWFAYVGALAVVAGAVSSSQAATVIRTNDGMGADTEVRESETNAQLDENFNNILRGVNKGTNTELATRANNTTTTATNDRSSVMFMKFDISSLPGSGDAYWTTHDEVKLRVHVRNNNINESRIYEVKPGLPAVRADGSGLKIFKNFQRQVLHVRALEPTATFADDVGGSDTRMDDFGNSFDSPHNKYNWDEGDSTLGSGITFYDAPGITPHCISADFGCSTTESIGLYDDFNSDTRFIGEWMWPRVTPANHLPVGLPIDFKSPALKQLVLDAKDAGRTTVTLMVNFGADTNAGVTTPNNHLNFNYLVIPKDMLTLNNDSNYEPIDADNVVTGSPYSCSHATNCPGMTLGDNTGGAFSPKLIIKIPEPASMALAGLGMLMAATVMRRRRK